MLSGMGYKQRLEHRVGEGLRTSRSCNVALPLLCRRYEGRETPKARRTTFPRSPRDACHVTAGRSAPGRLAPSCVLCRFPLLSPPPGLRSDAAGAGAEPEPSRSRRDTETWRPEPACAIPAAAAITACRLVLFPLCRPLVCR